MDYTSIITFLTIAETRSLSKAAEKLYTSQSTISYRLKVLEKEVGAELFDREQGKGFITITTKGKEFVSIAQRMVSILKNIEGWKLKKPLNELKIGCVDSINVCIFNDLYKSVILSDSNLLLNLSTHWTITIYELVENYELDVGFALRQLPLKNIISKPIFNEKRVLISSADTNLPDEVCPEDVDISKEIYFYGELDFHLWHDNWLFNGEHHEYMTVDSVSLLNSFIDIPCYWSIVPISIAQKIKKTTNIKISKILNPPPDRICYQITNKSPMPNKLKTLESFEKYLNNFLSGDFFNSFMNF